MLPLTVFLLAAAIALAIGVFILEATKPKQKWLQRSLAEANQEQIAPSIRLSIQEQLALIHSGQAALNEKILLAHQRLQHIEGFLLQASRPKRQKQIAFEATLTNDALEKKVSRLLDFKSNIEIEVAAIKEILKEKGIYPKDNPKNGRLEKMFGRLDSDLDELEKRAHEVVYHSSTTNH